MCTAEHFQDGWLARPGRVKRIERKTGGRSEVCYAATGAGGRGEPGVDEGDSTGATGSALLSDLSRRVTPAAARPRATTPEPTTKRRLVVRITIQIPRSMARS